LIKSSSLRLRGKSSSMDSAAPAADGHVGGNSLAQLLAGTGAQAIAQPAKPTIFGTTFDDVITGTAGADRIEDIWGDDTIDGGDGDDVIVD
jgi:Ca2+-binding RTX toxin-like protein